MSRLLRKEHGEVLTPAWLIRRMLVQAAEGFGGSLAGVTVGDIGANRGQFLTEAIKIWPDINPMDWILIEVQDRYHRYHRRFTGWRVVKALKDPVELLIGNPPYNGGLDLKILLAMNEAKLLRRVVCVHPSTWLVDVKTQLGPRTGNHLFRKFQDMVGPHLKSVHLFNGNPVFGIGLFVPCVVTDMDMGWTRQQGTSIKVKDVGQDEYREVFGLEDITLHGKDWDPTVKEFMGRVQKLCAKNGSLGSRYEDPTKVTQGTPVVQLATIIGNWTATSALKMVKEDFYTFLQKVPSHNVGIRKQNERMPAITLQTAVEVGNLLGYLQTDFARMCLAIIKTSQRLESSDTALVPWLDFTRSWNDDQLFSMLGYPRGHAIREYAKRFLPDYHNIYPNGKTY